MSAPHAKSWIALDVNAAGNAREAIEYGLMEAGALGTETTTVDDDCFNVRGYFETGTDVDMVRDALFEALRIHGRPTSSSLNLKTSEIADRDWLAEWKKNWQPVEAGRFIIAPPWIESVTGAVTTGSFGQRGSHDPVATTPDTDPILIRINPGMAFGTGTHETTRLCLKAIEKHFGGGSFLDVGTGTGILAIAAAKMCQKPGPGSLAITACDTDADAVAIAKENAELNDVADRIDFRVGSVDEQTPSADFVCANLTASVIVELLPALVGATCGRLVVSGILDSQIDLIQPRMAELGIADFEINQDGEWIALVI